MAPLQTRKRKSDEMATPEAVTPTGSPAPKKMKITVLQKQALIDNLQLEVTERARRLRAQYAIQCKDLRSRIERRVHRIPVAIRNITMAELMAQHEEIKKPAAPSPIKTQEHVLPPPPTVEIPPVPSHVHQDQKQPTPQQEAQPPRSRKRKSSTIHIASDKENDQEPTTTAPEALPMAKNAKRAKTTTRTASRTQKPAHTHEQVGILSPRSHNSRTLPRSPIKEKDMAPPPSPSKLYQNSFIARPISPLKPNSPLKSAATAATSAISASVHGMIENARNRAHLTKPIRTTSTRKPSKETKPPTTTKTTRAGSRPISALSTHSIDTEVSTATNSTVITKSRRTTTKKTMAPPANPFKTAAATKIVLKKSANVNANVPAKKVVVAEPAAGKRVLRKRA